MNEVFVALDVETANPDLASICQIGVVTFADGAPSSSWQTLVNPEDYFDPWNVAIHGITEDAVADSPTFPQLLPQVRPLVSQRVVVCHTPFDWVSLGRASKKYGCEPVPCTWLDSAKVVRRTWPECARTGYALAKITATLGIMYQQHVAAEDARAAGELVLRAMESTGLTLADWLVRVKQPIATQHTARQGNPDGPLAGEAVVFTGALSLPRRDAADLAAEAGCTIDEGVTRETTLLVVGDQDIRRLAGHEKSSKHRKAEQLIEEGLHIRILGEADFRRLVGIDKVAGTP